MRRAVGKERGRNGLRMNTERQVLDFHIMTTEKRKRIRQN
jgi:hypothetical protein